MQSQQLYDKYAEGRHWEKHPTVYAERFVHFLKKKKIGGMIIDVGCGNGRDVDIFADAGFKTLGIDYAKEEIAKAQQKFTQLSFEVQNVEHLKLQNSAVDAIYMINVIHYVKKEKALQEIFRTLKQKGYFFIHFNLSIIDKNGKVDYIHQTEDILKLISAFKIIHRKIFERVDTVPVEHTHKIMELILQKI